MPWTEYNYKSKKALKEAVKQGPVPCWQPGPFGPDVRDGRSVIEGPHECHRWYASVLVKDNKIVKVLS